MNTGRQGPVRQVWGAQVKRGGGPATTRGNQLVVGDGQVNSHRSASDQGRDRGEWGAVGALKGGGEQGGKPEGSI